MQEAFIIMLDSDEHASVIATICSVSSAIAGYFCLLPYYLSADDYLL